MATADYINKIINANAIDGLKLLDDNSINMCVTSPPYWGLRDYGTEPIVWDGVEGCEHEWGLEKIDIRQPQRDVCGGFGGSPGTRNQEYNKASGSDLNRGCWCQKCNAWKGQLGLEPDFKLYIKHLCDIFDEVKRVLTDDGTCWVNISDTYWGGGNASGHTNNTKNLGYTTSNMGATKSHATGKQYMDKCLVGIPERFMLEMIDRGWILRNKIIWYKSNCMPSSVNDRFTVDFEMLYFFVKNKKYYFEQQFEPLQCTNVKSKNATNKHEGYGNPTYSGFEYDSNDYPQGRNKRCVWNINPKPFKDAHFAVFPPELIETPINAGCPQNGIVIDTFMGSGTTALVALMNNKQYIGIELNSKYIDIANKRLAKLPNTKLNQFF